MPAIDSTEWEPVETKSPSPEWEPVKAPLDESKIKIDPYEAFQLQHGRQDPFGARDTGLLSYLVNNPGAAAKQLAQTPLTALSGVGDIARGAAADLVSKISGDKEYGGNLEVTSPNEELPVDRFLNKVSETNPNLATVGKIGQGLAKSAPGFVAGGLPGAVGKAALAGFTGNMVLNDAPRIATELGEELGKPKSERDPAKLSSLYSDAIQTGLFSAAGGLGLKELGKDVALTKGDALRVGARDMEAATRPGAVDLPESAPAPMRRLGVTAPSPSALETPELQALANRGILEAQPGRILVPGEVPAVDLLKAAHTPLETVEKPGGQIDRGGGKISFAGEAGAKAVPSARQSAIETPPKVAPEPAPRVDFSDRGATDDFRKSLESPDFKGGNDLSNEAGMKVKSIADLEELAKLRDKYVQQSREMLAGIQAKKKLDPKADIVGDFVKAQAAGQKAQLAREAIETATNSGSHVEGEGSIKEKLGERPLDWSKNPEVANWLKANGEKLGIDTSNIETPVEGVTPLDPQTGAPPSATDAAINRTQAASLPTAKPATPEQVRQKNIADRAESKLAEIQANIRSGKYQFSGITGLEPVMIDGALTVARAALKATSSVIQSIDAAVKFLKEKYPNAKFNPEEVADWINKNVSEPQKEGEAPKAEAAPESAPVENPQGSQPQSGKGLASKIGDSFTKVADYTTIDPVPKLTRAGVQNEAVQHAYARAAIPRMVDDLLSKVFPDSYTNPEAVAKTMDILNKDDILGGYDDFLNRANAEAKAGNSEGAARWQKMADSVGSKQDLEKLAAEVEAAKSNPEISGSIERWKSLVNPELDQLYNEIKGVNPNTPREGRGRVFGGRVNLLPKSEEGKWSEMLNDDQKPIPSPSSSNYRNPNAKRDRFDRLAKFTGDYSTNPAAVLANVLSPRWNEVTKLRLYDALVKSGKAAWVEPGAEMPSQIGGEPAKRLPVKVPLTDELGATTQVERSLAVPESLVSEIRGVLDTDLSPSRNPIAAALTKLQLAQLADAVTHGKNLHSVITTAQGTKSFWTDVAKKMPGLASVDAAVRIAKTIYEIHQDSPAIRSELSFLARNGMLRESYPASGLQKITKMQDSIHEVDTASRVIMNRFYDNLIERGLAKDDMVQRRKFVQQVGEYNKRLMSPKMREMSRSGFSPFIVAGRNFNRFGKRTLAGSYGFEAASPKAGLQMRLVNLATLASVFVIPMMANYVMHGSIYGRPGTPLGAIDLNSKEDAKGNHKVLDLAQLYGVRRGMRATGVESIAEGIRAGKTPTEIVDKGLMDVASTAAHPWLGPALGFGFQAATGSRLDLRGGPTPIEARKVDRGHSQVAENMRVALKNQNPLLYSFIRPIADDTESGYGKDIAKDFLKSPYGALGIRDAKSPALQRANEILRQKLPVGGMSAERSKERIEESEIVSRIRDGEVSLPDAVKSGKINPKDLSDVKERLAQTPLQYSLKRLSADEAKDVYDRASDKEKEEIGRTFKLKQLGQEGSKEAQARNERAEESIADAPSVQDAIKNYVAKNGKDVEGVKRVVQLFQAKERGATVDDRRLLSLPVSQRAEFIAEEFGKTPPEKKREVLLDYARKKILTEAVATELVKKLQANK